MTNSKKSSAADWAVKWLESVSSGSSKMSQRTLSSIDKHGGGLQAVASLAKQKGVHLLLIKDDKGNQLIAASVNSFTVVC